MALTLAHGVFCQGLSASMLPLVEATEGLDGLICRTQTSAEPPRLWAAPRNIHLIPLRILLLHLP